MANLKISLPIIIVLIDHTRTTRGAVIVSIDGSRADGASRSFVHSTPAAVIAHRHYFARILAVVADARLFAVWLHVRHSFAIYQIAGIVV